MQCALTIDIAAVSQVIALRPWEIILAFLLTADFFQNQFFPKIISRVP